MRTDVYAAGVGARDGGESVGLKRRRDRGWTGWWRAVMCAMALASAVAGVVAGRAEPVPEGRVAPSVGIFTGLAGLPIERHFRESGWQTACLRWGQAFDTTALRRFNVIVLSEYPAVAADAPGNTNLGVHPDYDAQMRNLLADYVEHGGGLLVYGGDFPMAMQPTNGLLARWGAELLDETVEDGAHAFLQEGGMQWAYQYTDNVATHAATAGVRTIFYPLRSVYNAAVMPVRVDDRWQVLVRGTKAARSRPLVRRQEKAVADEGRPGTYETEPPLAAVRPAGLGRVAVFGWSPIQTFFDYGHPMVANIYFSQGSGVRPSDGLRLLDQTLAYLAEPSQANHIPGYGGQIEQVPLATRPPPAKPVLWRNAVPPNDVAGARWYRGVIGARTALTGGHGTVAEFAAAARAAKLDYIAFMEDFARLDQAKWDRFRAECRAATGPDLLVLPGLAVQRGKAGDWYFKISDFDWPRRDMLSADGRRIDNYLFEHFESGLNTDGPFDLRREPSPAWLSRAYNSIAVATTRGGRTELDLPTFLSQVEIQDNPRPVAVDLIESPTEVAAAARRLVNLRLGTSQGELERTLKDPDAGRPAQISNGPCITTWQGSNLSRETLDRIVSGTERLQLHLRAESEVPLAEAIVFDGTKVFRHFRFDGQKNCDLVVNGLHDRQRQFSVLVRDTAGHFALRSGLSTTDLATRRFMCGDRQNSLANGYVVDPEGDEVSIGTAFQQSKLAMGRLGYPANPETVSHVPWYWDGRPGGYVEGGVQNAETPGSHGRPQRPGTETALVSRMEFPLGSRDVICQQMDTEAVMPDHPFHEGGFWPVQTLSGYRAQTRCFEFRKTPDGPSAMLIEGEYTMLADGKWQAGDWYWRSFSQIFYTLGGSVDSSCQWALVGADGTRRGGVAPPREHPASFVTHLAPGGYVAYVKPGESGAVFPLDRPLLIAQELHRENWFRAWLGYDRLGQQYRAGDTIPYRLVVFTGSRSASPDTHEIDEFRRAFSIGGGTPAYRVQPRVGRIRSTDYVLELEADRGGFGGTVGAAQLPNRLPIRVHGVNPNWTAAIVEQDEKWWLPIGVLDGAGYVALDTTREHRVWIGNVVMCDQPDLILTLLPDGAGKFSIEAHNPSSQAVTTTLRTSPEFNLVRPASFRASVPAGASVVVDLP